MTYTVGNRLSDRTRQWLINLGVVAASLLILFILLEFVVFRYLLKASDFPRVQSINDVIRYQPRQTGVMRIKDEIAAPFAINENGWNSVHSVYDPIRDQLKKRIAIIGDSYVEGFSVDYHKSTAEVLEALSGKENWEVYRFGIGGAPMSQYLHMLRKEVLRYGPDMIVIVLIHNDFDESYIFSQSLYDSYFMKLLINDDKIVRERLPEPYRPQWYTPIRYSAIWRYLHVREQVRFSALKDILIGEKFYQANVDIRAVDKMERFNVLATEYIFAEFQRVCRQHGMTLLIVMDGDRGRIYQKGKDLMDYNTGALKLNRLASNTAARLGIDFIDMHPIFSTEYLRNETRFEFPHDNHWNEAAHRLVAETIYDHMKSSGLPPDGRSFSHLTIGTSFKRRIQ